jgi:manganese-dependent inorganic pyrophosphatase
MPLKVIGHKSPDTDATCSAIVYAWYLTNHQATPAKPYIDGTTNKEADFVLKKFGFDKPPQIKQLTAEDRYVLVDTNNPDELIDGIHDAQLIELVDHHKLVGGLSTANPISVTIWPLASTCSVIWKIMQHNQHTDIPKEIASLMLASIISDTLKFTSPTTTEFDKQAAQKLTQIAGLDIDQLAQDMFAAKSDLTGFTPEDILLTDSKIFDMHGHKVRISVLETTKPDNALALQADLEAAMKDLQSKEKLDHIFFAVVDIINTESTLLAITDKARQVAEVAFESKFTNDRLHLPGVVSRKKQIAPQIEAALG